MLLFTKHHIIMLYEKGKKCKRKLWFFGQNLNSR